MEGEFALKFLIASKRHNDTKGGQGRQKGGEGGLEKKSTT